jgi:shikimate kinase
LVADALGDFLAHWLNFDAFDSDRFISKSDQRLKKIFRKTEKKHHGFARILSKQ